MAFIKFFCLIKYTIVLVFDWLAQDHAWDSIYWIMFFNIVLVSWVMILSMLLGINATGIKKIWH